MVDCAQSVCTTIATDIAHYNGDSATHCYGVLGSMMGVGFIAGPLLGGMCMRRMWARVKGSNGCLQYLLSQSLHSGVFIYVCRLNYRPPFFAALPASGGSAGLGGWCPHLPAARG
ncbi:hypothetical protein EON64_19940, partial [archaeon]